ncbi:DUF6475 domain-containing protein [uncultured Campylobacter sp.]|uniref:DUF6475 domain-containing protein n=1 Tax=uncultured Campylobacter sp. TaxID=218934 RepID=UPI0025CCBF38|nr:DUF6475 domain-containing protein [uncultured Campylobacter sp.]
MTMQEFYGVFMPTVEYYGGNLSKAAIALYFEDLMGYEARELAAALKLVRQTRKYPTMPTSAEILEALNGDESAKAQKALDELVYAIGRYGPYRSVCFKDGAIMSVVRARGGWVKVCNLEGQDWENFKKWDFAKLYKTYAKTPQICPDYLIGESEAINGFNGVGGNEPVYFIGGANDGKFMGAAKFKALTGQKSPVKAMVTGAVKRIGV